MFSLPTKPQTFFTIYPYVIDFWRHIVKRVQIPALFLTALMTFPYYLMFYRHLHSLLIHQHSHSLRVEQLWLTIATLIFYFLALVAMVIIILQANAILKNMKSPSYSGTFLLGILKLPTLILAIIIAVVTVTLGSCVFLIPGLYLFFIIPLYIQLVILEKTNPFKTFSLCLDLIYSNWWRTFFTIYIPALIFISVIFLIESFVRTKFIVQLNHVYLDIGLIITKIVLTAIYIPWFVSVTLIQLHDLVLRSNQAEKKT